MITNFQQIRADGKLLPNDMNIEEMFARGWEPCKVTLIRWDNNGQSVEMKHEGGMLAEVLPSKELIVILIGEELNPKSDDMSALNNVSVFNADGSLRHIISNTQEIRGKQEPGSFAWFEKFDSPSKDTIGLVFEPNINRAQYLMVLDALNGTLSVARQMS